MRNFAPINEGSVRQNSKFSQICSFSSRRGDTNQSPWSFAWKRISHVHCRVTNFTPIKEGGWVLEPSNVPKSVKFEASHPQAWHDAPIQVKFAVEEHTMVLSDSDKFPSDQRVVEPSIFTVCALYPADLEANRRHLRFVFVIINRVAKISLEWR